MKGPENSEIKIKALIDEFELCAVLMPYS